MGRMVDIDDLVGADQIAEHYGISRQAVDLWTRKADFPAPVATWGGRVWLLPEVVAWRDTRPPQGQRVAHGTKNRYNRGCRCERCTDANTTYQRKWAARSTPLPDGDPRHGTLNGYSNWRCRCDPCKAVGAEANRVTRERRLARRKGAA